MFSDYSFTATQAINYNNNNGNMVELESFSLYSLKTLVKSMTDDLQLNG
jgi:hypothetical protein